MRCRPASAQHAALLAPLNHQLIRDEGHRNPMTVEQLAARMAGWLDAERGEYEATLIEEDDALAGYALFRRDPEGIYLRQFFIKPEFRRRGLGRAAIHWLWVNAWPAAPRLRIEVLLGNQAGRAFWRALGFSEYCVTMEMLPPDSRTPKSASAARDDADETIGA